MEEDNNKLHLFNIVQEAINETNLWKKIKLVHIIFHSLLLEQINQKEIKLHNIIEKKIKDINFMRELRLNSTIKENPATAIEYLGTDFLGGDPNMYFSFDFENEINKLEIQIDEYLGVVIQELIKTEMISFENP